MGKLIYSMGVSLDGYIVGPDGGFDWAMPDEEQHRFHNEQARALGGHLLGRGLYETMLYWETAEEDTSLPDYEREFAAVWKQLPKVVFSTTLAEVEGNARLATGEPAEELARLRQETDGDIAVGGATLAVACIEQGLVDEYGPLVSPAVAGGGTPFLPPLEERVELELVETRTFASRVVYMRYSA